MPRNPILSFMLWAQFEPGVRSAATCVFCTLLLVRHEKHRAKQDAGLMQISVLMVQSHPRLSVENGLPAGSLQDKATSEGVGELL